MPAAPAAPARRAARDLALVAGVAAATFTVASYFEWFERFGRTAARLEHWQLDELPFVLLVVAFGLAWFAWQRWRDARSALRLHEAAEARVGELLARNRALAQQLIGVQEQERRALARELHDELGQACTALRVEAALVARAAGPARAAVESAARIDGLAEGLQQHVRTMLQRLRPADLDALGLPAALEALAAQWQGSSGIRCEVRVSPALPVLGDVADVALYRVAQEALTNTVRHARATTARLDLTVDPGPDPGSGEAVVLCVRDDGIGADLDVPRRGLGLLGAAERAAALGGTLELDSTPGTGFALTLRLPAVPPVAGRSA